MTFVSRSCGLGGRVFFFCLVIASNAVAQVPATGWTSIDIGGAMPGSTTPTSGGFSVRAAGDDIWGRSDIFRFVYHRLPGDGAIVTRVANWEYPNGWSKAGLMVRESLASNSRHAFLLVSGTHGLAFHRRDRAGDATSELADLAGAAPTWLRLERQGSTILASTSSNGTSWTLLARESISFSGNLYVGLAMTSHAPRAYATADFANLTLSGTSVPTSGTSVPTNQPPTVSITSPVSGATFLAPATLAVMADASDPDGTVASVEFYAGTTRIGTDTTSPYSVTWSNVPAGTYSLTAVARDLAGGMTVSSDRTVTVTSLTQLTRRAVFTPSSNHATAVAHYVLDVYLAGSDPRTANPVASIDLGKPNVVNGDCSVDITAFVTALRTGLYIATVTAIGPAGSAESAPSSQFSR